MTFRPWSVVTVSELRDFIKGHRLAVEASVSTGGGAQAAVVGIGVTESLELVFDTLDSTRKFQNIEKNPRVAFVIGGHIEGDERTLQYEGVADIPDGTERARVTRAYFEAWPDGVSRESWPGLVYVRVRPTWMRFSDFNQNPPLIVEWTADEIARLTGVGRRIVGFHQDADKDWVADLECGHTQHVRHDPPWRQHPWVVTERGRAEHIGTSLRCVLCKSA